MEAYLIEINYSQHFITAGSEKLFLTIRKNDNWIL